jgi:hypothetical protein
MAGTLQQFLIKAIPEAANNLETAVNRLPVDKRSWSPMGDARSAINMVAECAMLCDPTKIVETRSFGDFDFMAYQKQRDELANNPAEAWSLLKANVDRAVACIQSVPDTDLDIEIQMPFGTFTIAQVIAYAYWNMSYHEGQINYIASMLGCLD